MRANNKLAALRAAPVLLLVTAAATYGCGATTKDTLPSRPAVKPDRWGGNHILFAKQNDLNLRKIDSDGEDEDALTLFGEGGDRAAWSPNGQKVAYVATEQENEEKPVTKAIYLTDEEGLDSKRLTDPALAATDPSWSPDGKTVAFAGRNRINRSFDIYTVKTDGSGIRQITNTPLDELHPSWSPYGDSIAFSAEQQGKNKDSHQQTHPQWDIYTVNPTRGNLQKLIGDESTDELLPEWSPDGRWIAFVTKDAIGQQLSWAQSNGRGKQSLAVREEPQGLTWSPSAREILTGGEELRLLNIYERKPLLRTLWLDKESFLETKGTKSFPTWAS